MDSQYGITLVAIVGSLSEERVREMTDDANTGAIDETVAAEAVAASERELHLRLAPYYATPIRTAANTIPEGLADVVIRDVRYRLASRRTDVVNTEHGEGKYWQSQRDEVLAFYELYANPDARKRASIAGAVPAAAEATPDPAGARITSVAARFTDDNMRSFFGS